MDRSKTAQLPGDTTAAHWIREMSNTAALTVLIYEKCRQIDLVWRERKSWITVAPLWMAFQLTIVALTGTSATAMYEYDILSVSCFNDFGCIVTILGKYVVTLLMTLSVQVAIAAPDEFSQPRRDVVARLVLHDPLSNAPARPWSPY
ncbi:hypothetical protein EDD17DRAFT_1657309 [Pisolithus thermaeus]|nr:hypothetical protein EDD17DRAFT_1657309 [Pisolithus thermaeus]